MGARTDLAVETARKLSLTKDLDGITRKIDIVSSAQAEIADITIETEEAAKLIGRPKGRYITIKALEGTFDNYCECFDERTQLIAKQIRTLCPDAKSVLVVGLGNRSITADAVGSLCIDKIFATRHIKKYTAEIDHSELTELCAIETGVLGRTGIESGEQVKAICGAVRPDVVIAVDALACWELDHLGRTIQLCDTGISPGSGVENARKELSRATLGVTCIAVGVPMVVDLSSAAEMIFERTAPENSIGMTVTPGNVDRLASNAAEYIAMGINQAFQPTLDPQSIRSLL